ncbi:MAG: DedA family protein [Firmicutes bacterium]|nr:DedA family protein [Bacillota bacterium]
MDPILLTVRHAYFVLFGGLWLEYLGLPIPGELILLLAGALASMGHLNLWVVLGLATLAVMLGDHVWYLAGRRGGQRWLHLFCRLTLGSQQCVGRTEGFFQRFGPVSLLLAKFIPGFRTFAAPLAGMTHLGYRTFLLFDLLGSVLWITVVTLAGFWTGPHREMGPSQFSAGSRLVWILLAALVLGVLAVRIWGRWKYGTPLSRPAAPVPENECGSIPWPESASHRSQG